MSERKVINKYYPPDFDPAKIPRGKKPKNNQVTVRMMLPMSVRCNTCGEYLYKGKKFNAKKETVLGEEYLGVKIFRFYMRCVSCSSEFTIKTDPQESDYVCENGASRNFEPWRDNEKKIEEIKKQREQEEEGDAMKALENRTLDSKVEMDIIEALDEIRAVNARNSKIDSTTLLLQHKQTDEEKEKQLDEEDEDLLRATVFKNSTSYVKRLDDIDQDEPTPKKQKTNEEKTVEPKVSFLPIPKGSNDQKPKISKVQIVPKVQITPKVQVTPKIQVFSKASSKENPSNVTSLVNY